LYVVDMYRGMIQDAPWVGPEFADRIRRLGADQVTCHGRIWRIAPDGFRRPKPPRSLDASPAELVASLASENGWVRDTAQRLIILRGDRSVVAALSAMARSHGAPLARLHALWTLEGLDSLDKALVFTAQRDADPRVRAAAVRLTEPWLKAGDAAALAHAAAMANDPDVTVCRQLILSLGFSTAPATIDTIDAVIRRHLDNEKICLAAMTALWNRETPLVRRMRDGSAFAAIADATVRAAATQLWQGGIAAWAAADLRKPRATDAATAKLVEQGAAIYHGLCASCHAPDGRGVLLDGYPRLAPPLDGSPRVTGAKGRLIRIALHGLQGPVDGQTYEAGQMMPLGANDDAYIAAVLSYVRQGWANEADAVRPADVAAVRKEAGGRTTPWTVKDLEGVLPK
jgi:mono/diheme cytochrome c family protein